MIKMVEEINNGLLDDHILEEWEWHVKRCV